MAFDPLFVKICCPCKRYQDRKDNELRENFLVNSRQFPMYILSTYYSCKKFQIMCTTFYKFMESFIFHNSSYTSFPKIPANRTRCLPYPPLCENHCILSTCSIIHYKPLQEDNQRILRSTRVTRDFAGNTTSGKIGITC